MEAIMRTLGTHFFSYVGKRLKTSQSYRELRERWVRDNYDQSVRDMFQAIVKDAQVNVELPESVVDDLLTDDTNRTEVFRWIIENISLEQFDKNRLNLDAYFELHDRYQDKLVPFFQVMIIKIKDYKRKYSHLEFLQIGSQLDLIGGNIEKVYEEVERLGEMVSRQFKDQRALITDVLSSPGIEDLNELISEGNYEAAKQRALERLKRPLISPEDKIELNLIVAHAILQSDNQSDAIPYYQVAYDFCNERSRQLRFQTIIALLRTDFQKAMGIITEAIRLEGETEKNVQLLINVLTATGDYEEALTKLDRLKGSHWDEARANVLLESGRYEELICLADNNLSCTQSITDTWLMFKAEGIVLGLDQKITSGVPCNIEATTNDAFGILAQTSNIVKNARWVSRNKELQAYLYFRRGEFAESKIMYANLLKTEGPIAVGKYGEQYLSACLLDGDWEQAATYLEDKLASGQGDLEQVLKLSRVYVDRGTPQDSIRLLIEKQAPFIQPEGQLSIDFYMAALYAAHYNVSVDTSNFVHKLRSGVEQDSVEMKVIDSYSAFLAKDWDVAIIGLENCIQIVSQHNVAEIRTCLVEAYSARATLVDFEKLVQLIPQIPVWHYSAGLINRFVVSLYNTGQYERILDIYKTGYYIDSIALLDAATAIYYNYGWYSLAAENFNILFRRTKEIEYLLQYARCLYSMGNMNECIDAIKRAESEVESKGSIHDLYLLSVANKDVGEMHTAAQYAFRAYNQGKENPDVCRFYFILMSEISRFLTGPDPDWISAYHEVINGFHNKFPDERPLFEVFNPLNADNSISDDFINRLREMDAGHKDMAKWYKQLKMPVTWLADKLNKGIYETWGKIITDNDMDVWIMSGIGSELNLRRKNAKLCSVVLCDLGTLLTVRRLELLDNLASRYAKLLVHQTQLNTLLEEKRRLQLIADEGLVTMGIDSNSGQLYLSKATANDVQKELESLNDFVTWIDRHCEVVGRVIKQTKIDPLYSTAFGESIIEIIKSSSEQKAVLLFDSGIVCHVAKEAFNVSSFTSFDLLSLLAHEKEISEESFVDSYINLLKLGYTLLPIDDKLLWFVVQKRVFQLGHSDVQAWFRYFSREEFNMEFKLRVAAAFLRTMWLEAEAAPFRNAVTDNICSSLVGTHSKAAIIRRLLDLANPLFSPLVEHQRKQMESCVVAWVRSQNWI